MLEVAVTATKNSIQSDFLIESSMYLGVLYQHLGWLEIDIEYWEKLHSICQKPNASNGIKKLPTHKPNSKSLSWFKKSYGYTKHVVNELEKTPQKKARLGPAYLYLAVNCAVLGKNVKAAAYSSRGHDICLANYSRDNVRVGWSFLMQAMTYAFLENYDKAVEAYKGCLTNFENHFAKEDAFIFFASYNLALSLHRAGKYEKSNKILKELISIRGMSNNPTRNKILNVLIKNLFSQLGSGNNKKIQSMIDGYTALLCGEVSRMDYFQEKKK